jgi:hypothetical protein
VGFPQPRSEAAPMFGLPRPATLRPMHADNFMFLALEGVAVIAMVLLFLIVVVLGSHGPEMDG